MKSAPPSDLHALVADVVRSRNCSGCGACAALSPTLTMQLADDGFLVPVGDPAADPVPPTASEQFRAVCPGLSVRAAARDARESSDLLFGPYVSVWQAWAADPQIRRKGSSGGVLTALSAWLVDSARAARVVAAGASRNRPTRTVPVEITSREQALEAAGSRYAPVGVAALAGSIGAGDALVGKPCEVDAVRRLGRGAGDLPLLFSFFCAGVPSQHATAALIEDLGMDPREVTAVTYRGSGCPGDFIALAPDGAQVRASYQQSWGTHLGGRLHDRCKICPDGLGTHADITVGDFWPTDDRGYPTFDENDGVSVTFGRTARGHDLLIEARDAGVVVLRPIDLAEVAAAQPSQSRRRRELPGRLLGRWVAGRRPPRERGFDLMRRALSAPTANYRAFRGAYGRARRES